jgi:hypothetical protein
MAISCIINSTKEISMKKLSFVAMATLPVVVAIGTMLLTPSALATGKVGGRNIGIAYNVFGLIPVGPISEALPDASNWGVYSCASVHEKLVYINGSPFNQDRQECTLFSYPPGSLPKSAFTVSGTYLNAPLESDGVSKYYWLSDFIYTTEGLVLSADSWSYTIHPDGTFNIVSEYAIPCDTAEYGYDSATGNYDNQVCANPH